MEVQTIPEESQFDMNVKKFINSLSLKTEMPLYLLSFPYFINFSIIASMLDVDTLIQLGVVGGGLSMIPLLVGYLFRVKKLSPNLHRLQAYQDGSTEVDLSDLTRIKRTLILHPRWEGRVIILRWTLAIFGFIAIAIPLFSLSNLVVFALSYSCIMMIPVIYLTYYFQTEIHLTPILKSSILANVELDLNSIPTFSIFARNLFTQISIAILPLMTLSYYLFASHMGWLTIPNLWIQIPFLIIMMVAIILYLAIVGNHALQEDIVNLNESIERLSLGDLENTIPIVSNTNLNSILYRINGFILRLKSYFESIHNESARVRGSSESVHNYAESVYSDVKKETSSLESISQAVNSINELSNRILDTITNQTDRIGSLDLDLMKISDSMQTLSRKATELSSIAKRSVEHSEITNQVIKDSMEKVTQLVETNRNINETISIVEEISDQINLLSLNASIEAARAGEYGRGFAVVAQEVARLADKTQENIDRIKKVMKESNSYSQSSMNAMKSIQENFVSSWSDTELLASSIDVFSIESKMNSENVDHAKRTIGDIGIRGRDISGKIVEQWNKTSEINNLVDDMQEISGGMLSSFEKLKSLSQDIESVARELDASLREFRIQNQ